jgi:hypothetical protein
MPFVFVHVNRCNQYNKIDILYATWWTHMVDMEYNIFYPTLVLFEQSNCIDWINICYICYITGRRGRDPMVIGFTTTCAISSYYHWCCYFEPRSRRGVLDTTLCDKVWQWIATGRRFSPGTPVSSTNKTGRHDISEIMLKVALNTINQPTTI